MEDVAAFQIVGADVDSCEDDLFRTALDEAAGFGEEVEDLDAFENSLAHVCSAGSLN